MSLLQGLPIESGRSAGQQAQRQKNERRLWARVRSRIDLLLAGRKSVMSRLTNDQKMLLDRAKSLARISLKDGRRFRSFAVKINVRRQVEVQYASYRLESDQGAFVELVVSLEGQAAASNISTSILVMLMDDPLNDGEGSIVFDIEQVGEARVLAILPYRIYPSETNFGEATYHNTKAMSGLFQR